MPAVQNLATSAQYALTIGGVAMTQRVPADSISLSETGSDSIATMEFTVEYPQGSAPADSNQAVDVNEVVLLDTVNNRRLFGGYATRKTRTHMAGPGVALQVAAVSYDAWLDRRQLAKWQSTANVGGVVKKIDSDRKIVQSIIAAGVPWINASNTNVAETNVAMPKLISDAGSVRDALRDCAETAASTADPTARRFYVDFYSNLHYFKGNEGSTAPYIVGDADYVRVVRLTSGLISHWPLREASGTIAYDAPGANNGTYTGGYTQNTSSIVPNSQQTGALTLNGSSGYVTASGAALHQGDGPWSIEAWVRRDNSLIAQTIISAGTNDYYVGFDATDHIIVQKEGTGDNFVSTPTYSSATTVYHIVVTRAVGTTTVYVNGASVAGTTTARTFASAAGAVNIGRKLSTTNLFLRAKIAHVSFYNATLSAATVLAHYNAGRTVVPDYIDFTRDENDAGFSVYVKGGNAVGSGWALTNKYVSKYGHNFIIDRPQSTTQAIREAIATAFLQRDAAPTLGGKITVTNFDGWRAGQTLTIADAGLGINTTYEIKYIEAYFSGTTNITYDIYYGAMPYRAMFDVMRKRRTGGKGGLP